MSIARKASDKEISVVVGSRRQVGEADDMANAQTSRNRIRTKCELGCRVVRNRSREFGIAQSHGCRLSPAACSLEEIPIGAARQLTIDAAVDPLGTMAKIGDLPMQNDFRALVRVLFQVQR